MTQDTGTTEAGLAPLFAPARVGGLDLRNRFAMAPMTRGFSPDGVPGPNVADYYVRRAMGGIGLIITEGTWINHSYASYDSTVPNFFGDAALRGWRAVLEGVHAAGARIVPQLWNAGVFKKRGSKGNTRPEGFPARGGPSGYLNATEKVTEPMSRDDIAATIAAYGDGAAAALQLGFDGIEIHGAHGYLIDQFFWSATNRRSDEFGGDLTSRSRLAAEVIRECRRRTRPEFPIIFRYSQWKQQDYTTRLAANPRELEQMLAPIVDAGADIIHPSTRRYWDPAFEGSDLTLSGWTRKITGKPTIIVGAIGLDRDMGAGPSAAVTDLAQLAQKFQRQEFDIAAVGRALISNPDWYHLNQRREWHLARSYSTEHLTTLA